MSKRRGQAAMEFLMTYGWAILAAVIAIGVLAYFGVFSPGKYTTGTTVVNPPFYANAWNVGEASGAVNLELKNNGGEDYNITSVDLTGEPTGVACTADDAVGVVSPGDVIVATMNCTGLSEGNSFKSDIVISYVKSGSSLSLTSTGTIAEKVVA